MKPKLKPPGAKRLKLNCNVPLSTSAFKFNLRRYNSATTCLGQTPSRDSATSFDGRIPELQVPREQFPAAVVEPQPSKKC